MKVVMIGTGYVGLVSGTCFAEIGHKVTCIDIDKDKIDTLKKGQSPIYEPGLTELLERNIKDGRIHFSTDYSSVSKADVVFLGVGTPSAEDGSANLTYLESATIEVAKRIKDRTVIVIKSTVPIGTNSKIHKLISEHTDQSFFLVNNPEFLKEGSAVEDFMRPDRVIIGHSDPYAGEVMEELYEPLVRQGNPVLHMSNLSAEMSKYASNCFLATKISFINELARLCDLTGADIEEVRKGMGSDKRIGSQFLYPGPGYGGSCFPKDVKALLYTAKQFGMKLDIVQATEDVNELQKIRVVEKIKSLYGDDLTGKTFAFWGVAFKANTDDIRESPAISMAKAIVQAGGRVRYFDPVADENFEQYVSLSVLKGHAHRFQNKYDCLNGADALVTVTEWREFKNPDFDEIRNRLKAPVIFDGRNLYRTSKILKEGFKYFAIGKKI